MTSYMKLTPDSPKAAAPTPAPAPKVDKKAAKKAELNLLLEGMTSSAKMIKANIDKLNSACMSQDEYALRCKLDGILEAKNKEIEKLVNRIRHL